ncbi:CPBP family intramembrane glutamic endopeptidase [Flavobacterium rhizosphaerae]|uniref:Type II CAAX endopeptidase family protein n=1 Tax=Flavobacterium rhizosphaerae TaxID=3163298 RepID=A0ABW8YT24_9FLAO
MPKDTLIKNKWIALLLLTIPVAMANFPIAKFPVKFIIITAVVFVFTWLQNGSLRPLNFKKLSLKDLGIIIITYIALELVMDFAIQPLISFLFNEPADYSTFAVLEGNTPKYLKYLFYMWISAAIGEEVLYRGFIFAQLEKLIGNKKFVIILISAILFAIPHLYLGIAGVVSTFVFGLAFGLLYARYKNIWINIIVHGLIDTLFLTLAYFGEIGFYE